MQHIRERASLVHGDTTLQSSVPDPSRALNIEVAYMKLMVWTFNSMFAWVDSAAPCTSTAGRVSFAVRNLEATIARRSGWTTANTSV